MRSLPKICYLPQKCHLLQNGQLALEGLPGLEIATLHLNGTTMLIEMDSLAQSWHLPQYLKIVI